jgi:hypothetical protein
MGPAHSRAAIQGVRMSIQGHLRWAGTAMGILVCSVALQAQSGGTLGNGWLRDALSLPNLILVATFLFHVVGVYFDIKKLKADMLDLKEFKSRVYDEFYPREVADLKFQPLSRTPRRGEQDHR